MKSRNQLRREKRKQKRHAEAQSDSTNQHDRPQQDSGTNGPTSSAGPTAGSEAIINDTARSSEKHDPNGSTQACEPKSSVTLLAKRFDWMNESSPLFGMYQQVSARFKHSGTSAEDKVDNNVGDRDGDKQEDEELDGVSDDSAVHAERSRDTAMSNKRRRMESKPSLAELKKESRRPELVDWYDADARDPHFLVFLKSLPYAVQVPSNWRKRSDIPNFPAQDPYELPASVKDTGIMEMRDPNGAQTAKQARIDVDYEKMHAAFFEHQDPPQLTRYGQVRDPKTRTLAFKPKKSVQPQFAPGSMSARLRDALGLGPDDEAPWVPAMKKHGPPPGFKLQDPVKFQYWGAI